LLDVDPARADSCPTASFAYAQPIEVDDGAAFVAVADLNNDRKPDLAVANQGSWDPVTSS
jgi:hypothetical protein